MRDDEKCGEPAPLRVNWPNRPPLAMCAAHAQKAALAAPTMGFYVHLEVLASPGTCQHAKERQ